MPRVKLTLEYDGTDFVGWQAQAHGRTVSQTLEAGLAKLLGEPVKVQAACRTDAGVHALGQVVVVDARATLPMKAYWMGLSDLLPRDLSVIAAEEVSDDFDPRRHSAGKSYRYLISNRPRRSPLLRRTHWELFAPLDVEAMRRAAPCLLGRHDFSAFRASDCQARHAIRELRRVELTASGTELCLWVEGTAFLKHMVRNLVGSLVEVGKGKQPPEWMAQVLEGRDRTRAGPTAAAHGLTLMEVFYPTTRRTLDEGDDDDG